MERTEDEHVPSVPPGELDALYCTGLPTTPRTEAGLVLVTGASGYIGGRLVLELLGRGYRVRCMVRGGDRESYAQRWPGADVVVADALAPSGLDAALDGVAVAYYLIHSLLLGPADFEEADRIAAQAFRDAAARCGVQQIIYLGGLGDMRESRSPHLRCRAEVAAELGAGSVPVTQLRAAVIIGGGSASYEIIRHLVGRMRLHLIPHWGRNRCQPIWVGDVLRYLVGVLESPDAMGRSFDIGGADILTYELMLRQFAEVTGKRIAFVTSPVSNIKLYAYAASLLTPVPAQITAALMEGLRDEVVCRDDAISRFVPLEPRSYKESVVMALTREEQDRVATRWSDAYPPAHELAMKLHELEDGPTHAVSYTLDTSKQRAALFDSVCRVGGRTGWFDGNWMWRARGGLDRIFFGVGTARGRKRRRALEVHDVIDFWRVEDLRRDRRLLLRAEMKLPGKAWLEFMIDDADDRRRFTISAYYQTSGLFGRAYWYAFWPFHHFIFNGLLKQIERRAAD